MNLVEDITAFDYTAINGVLSRCRVRIFSAPGSQPVVLVTEPGPIRNQGNAVPNSIEIIVGRIWKEHLHHLSQPPIVIEHFPRVMRDSVLGQESFTVVTFGKISRKGLADPKWDKISKERVEEMVGQEIPPATWLWAAYDEIAKRRDEVKALVEGGNLRDEPEQLHIYTGQYDALNWVVKLLEIDPNKGRRHY